MIDARGPSMSRSTSIGITVSTLFNTHCPGEEPDYQKIQECDKANVIQVYGHSHRMQTHSH